MTRPRRTSMRGNAPFRSIRFRITLIVAASVAISAAVLSTIVLAVVSYQLTSGQDTALEREAVRLQRSIESGADAAALSGGACRWTVETDCSRVISVDTAEGAGSHPALVVTREALDVAGGKLSEVFYTSTAVSPNVRIVALPLPEQQAILVGVPVTATTITLERIVHALATTSVLSCLAAVGIGFITGCAGVRPIRELITTVEDVARTQDPHTQVTVQRMDEIGKLARSFNHMLDKLARAGDAQRDFVADASHELRTPLTTLRTNTTLLFSSRAFDDETTVALQTAITAEVARMRTTVEDLIELARLDALADIPPARADLVATAVQELPNAQRHWPHVTYRLESDTGFSTVPLSPELLTRLLSVVLDNAGKYTAPSATTRPDVTVLIETLPHHMRTTITDHGIGLTEPGRVFDRFYRAPEARSLPGSGLGMAIARQIVTGAEGSIHAAGRTLGGTVVTIILPRVTPE